MSEFRKELAAAINKHSKENGSNTPDFLLAEYLEKCLESFDTIITKRELWYKPPPPEEAVEFSEKMIKNLPPERIAKVDGKQMFERIMERFNILNDELCNRMVTPDAKTRNEIRNKLKEYFPTCTVICDESNNPPDVVDSQCIIAKVIWKKHPSYEEISYVDLLFGSKEARENYMPY